MAGASPSPNPPTSQPASPTALAPAPTPTVDAAPTATAQLIPTATQAPAATDFEQSAPPLGELELPDRAAVAGYLGTWCYDGACADIIPPDKADLPLIDVPGGADLTFTLADTHPFVYWTVDYAAEQDDGTATMLAEGGSYVDPDMASATSPPELTTFNFEAPPAGDWVLGVNLQFAAGLGDAVYFWHVVVD
jgi:hypothetical protein